MTQSKQPIISAIVAMAENRAIGKGNQMPWHLPADLKHFKAITTGHPIIMGRKTFESIGKALPNRTNIVITRDAAFKADGCIVANSIEKGIKEATSHATDEIFVIGGAEIYKQSLPLIQRIYLTVVHKEFEGDAFFPQLEKNEWKEVGHETHPAEEVNVYSYSFLKLEKV
jgi:dihydrofolate reductase